MSDNIICRGCKTACESNCSIVYILVESGYDEAFSLKKILVCNSNTPPPNVKYTSLLLLSFSTLFKKLLLYNYNYYCLVCIHKLYLPLNS